MSATIHIVTPCMNAAATIDRTILSVVSQAGDFRVLYHVQDGGSTDGTLEKLGEWQRRIDLGMLPLACQRIRFSHVSEPDTGMYDALVRGFGRTDTGANAFLSWINADDILMPGALALVADVARQFQPTEVSWLGGAVAILRDDLPITTHVRPNPTPVLRAGLCDGVHWLYLQQEGTFFRRWLWEAVSPEKTIAPMRLAGDWNLWRLFAQKASLVQAGWPLGCFRIREGQLSESQLAAYRTEIDALLSPEARQAAFRELGRKGLVPRRRLEVAYDTGLLSVVEENGLADARARYVRCFGEEPDWPGADRLPEPATRRRLLFTGRRAPAVAPPTPLDRCLLRRPGLVACDADWQFPAITERHAFERLRAGLAGDGWGDAATYVAFPWATLIDKLQSRASDAEDHLDRFRDFCAALPPKGRRVTVCQHILMRNYLGLFAEAGIDEIFWSHATHADLGDPAEGAARIHPFPLYPVQVTEALAEAGPDFDPTADGADPAARRHLFSFVGARANAWYLTEVRNWILETLGNDPRGLVTGRDQWHYHRVVYEHQIRGEAGGDDKLEDDAAAQEFRALLRESVFALCPSGSGPNSIRLWEALGAGAIPVILADGWAPPGDPALWAAAAVFCAETPEAVAALPDRLAGIAADPARLTAMRQAMRQLWLLYGPANFTYDVEKRLRELAETAPETATAVAEAPASPALEAAAPAERLLLWAGRLLLDPARVDAVPAALAEARAALPEGHPAVLQFDRAQAHAAAIPRAVPAPAVRRRAALRICLFGRHSNRTPLSYAPLQRVAGDRIAFVTDAAAADVLLTGFAIDLRENADTLAALARAGRLPRVVVLSEEPLWDTVWSGDFTARRRRTLCDGVEIAHAMLNHETTGIFRFAEVPCFLLTSDDYAPRLAALIARQAAQTPQALLARWRRAPLQTAFVAEVREDPRYAVDFPDRDIRGLSVFRTEVARAVAAALPAGRVLCAGQGWGAAPRRQALPDWHLDKLATLQDRVLVASAYENTHHPQYISEKVFDAFAVGGIPTYVASPGHRIRALVPEAAMLNAHGLAAGAAAARIACLDPDAALAEAWLETARNLAALFRRADVLAAERRRVVAACLDEIERELDEPAGGAALSGAA